MEAKKEECQPFITGGPLAVFIAKHLFGGDGSPDNSCCVAVQRSLRWVGGLSLFIAPLVTSERKNTDIDAK